MKNQILDKTDFENDLINYYVATSLKMNMMNNFIYTDNSKLLNPATASIQPLYGTVTTFARDAVFTISNNEILLNDAECGIYISNSHRHLIQDSQIEFEKMGSNAYCLRLTGGDKHNAYRNEMSIAYGTTVSNTAAVIQLEQTGTPIITCNDISEYSFVIKSSQMNAMTDVKGNYLDNSKSGQFITLALNGLAPGVYILYIKKEDQIAEPFKFVKL